LKFLEILFAQAQAVSPLTLGVSFIWRLDLPFDDAARLFGLHIATHPDTPPQGTFNDGIQMVHWQMINGVAIYFLVGGSLESLLTYTSSENQEAI